MAMELYVFVNYTSSTYTLSVTTYESVDVYEMLTSGGPEQWVERLRRPKLSANFSVTMTDSFRSVSESLRKSLPSSRVKPIVLR